MSRSGWIVGAIAFLAAFGVPLAVGDPSAWPPSQLVALALAAAAAAALVVAMYEAVRADAPPPAPARPVTHRESWRGTLVVGLIVWAVMLFFLFVFGLADSGFRFVVSGAFWGIAVAMLVLCALIAVVVRYGAVTAGGVQAEEARRRAARPVRPGDVELLVAATPAVRQEWRRRARRRGLRRSGYRLAMSVLATAFVAREAADGWHVLLPTRVLPAVWLAAFLLSWGSVVADVRRDRGDPLLLDGEILTGIHGVVIVGGRVPGLGALAMSWIEHGSARTIGVAVTEAFRLRADGSLGPEPEWRGEHTIGVSRRVLRRAVEHERCVLVCTGSGTALSLLHDLAPG